jgi:glycine cleavage system H protein
MTPPELKYSRTHEWARLDAGNIVTMGITDFAVEQLGDIVFLEFPKPGTATKQGAPVGVIESVKAAIDLYAPVDGEVVEANSPLAENFDTLAKDPYGAGWMVKIKVAGPTALAGLMTAEEYQKHLEQEGK